MIIENKCIHQVNISTYRLPKITEEDLSSLRSLHGTPLAHISTGKNTVKTSLGAVPLGSILSYQVIQRLI